VCPAGFLPLPLGNVRTENVVSLYREHPVLRSIRTAEFTGRCGACSFREIRGGSRSRAVAAFGDPLAEDPACAYVPPGSTAAKASVYLTPVASPAEPGGGRPRAVGHGFATLSLPPCGCDRSMADDAGTDKIRDNPFYVLGLRPDATRAEVEREGQKLLGMLELGLASAARYATPVGPGERTADKVRRAMAALRDPERRLEHELWARLDAAAAPAPSPPPDVPPRTRADAPWPGAMVDLGWRAR
jgi:hypothetical protein